MIPCVPLGLNKRWFQGRLFRSLRHEKLDMQIRTSRRRRERRTLLYQCTEVSAVLSTISLGRARAKDNPRLGIPSQRGEFRVLGSGLWGPNTRYRIPVAKYRIPTLRRHGRPIAGNPRLATTRGGTCRHFSAFGPPSFSRRRGGKRPPGGNPPRGGNPPLGGRHGGACLLRLPILTVARPRRAVGTRLL